MDKSNSIIDEAFDYRVSKDDKVFITYYGKEVMILTGKNSAKFLARINKAETVEDEQMIMAKITGNFKRGNEKIYNFKGKR